MTNPDEQRQHLPLDAINRIELRDTGDLVLTQREERSLEVDAPGSITSYLNSEIRGDLLILSIDRKQLERDLGLNRSTLQNAVSYRVSLPHLCGLILSGAHRVTVERLHVKRLDVQMSGSNQVRIDDLRAQTLQVRWSGHGRLRLMGEVNEQALNITGCGNYRAAALHSRRTEVRINGQGDADVDASQSLHVVIAGEGTVAYSGNPSLFHSIVGAGSVHRLPFD